jgi:ribosomal protein S18 acetylase RimI-like enzyme
MESLLPQLTVRRYIPDDNEAVQHLHILALESAHVYFGDGYHDEDLDDIETVYLADRGEFLVVLYQEKFIAMGALRPQPDGSGEIKRMRVHPDFQGHGIGSMLLARLEERARELGYTLLRLDTSTRQHAAYHLYQKHGYQETHREKRLHVELIFMEKKLD